MKFRSGRSVNYFILTFAVNITGGKKQIGTLLMDETRPLGSSIPGIEFTIDDQILSFKITVSIPDKNTARRIAETPQTLALTIFMPAVIRFGQPRAVSIGGIPAVTALGAFMESEIRI